MKDGNRLRPLDSFILQFHLCISGCLRCGSHLLHRSQLHGQKPQTNRRLLIGDELMKLYVYLVLGVALLQGAAKVEGQKESFLVSQSTSPKGVVQGFIDTVRSGRAPEKASEFLAEQVSAHQLNSEGETTVMRTPASYTEHVHEFLNTYGRYHLTVTELISEGDRVYVRWRQEGRHLGSIQGFAPTGLPIVEITNAVYRVKDGKIVEYWIQTDRKGLELQLRANAAKDQAPR